jgi:hypothetical protein
VATLADVYDSIKDAVVATITALDLDGLAGGVQRQMVTDPSNISFPCIVVTSEGEREQVTGGDTTLKNVLFPVRVFFLDRESNRSAELEAQYAGWRGRLVDAFHQERLAGVPSVAGGTVEPNVIFDEKLSQYHFVVSGMVARFDTWVRRN